MFFKYFVQDLHGDGHEILCTGRKYRELTELAKIHDINIKIVGKHGGNDRYEKLIASIERTRKLSDIIKSFEPNLTVSFSSPEACRLSFGLGIDHYVFNDSPHAEAVGRLCIPLSTRLFCPWVIPYKAWKNFGIDKSRIVRYKALDPVVWIRKQLEKSENIQYHHYEISELKKERENTILIRPEEVKASYITDNRNVQNSVTLIDSIIEKFSLSSNILILARYQDQVDFYKNRYQNKACVLENVVDGTSLLQDIDIFVGAGGTMSAEAVLLGKPVISISPIDFYVENFLINSGFIKKIRNQKELCKYISHIISNIRNKDRNKKKKPRIKVIEAENTNIEFIAQQPSSVFKRKLYERSAKLINSMDDPIKIFKKFIKNP
jgi:predicted glycosyltransferase